MHSLMIEPLVAQYNKTSNEFIQRIASWRSPSWSVLKNGLGIAASFNNGDQCPDGSGKPISVSIELLCSAQTQSTMVVKAHNPCEYVVQIQTTVGCAAG